MSVHVISLGDIVTDLIAPVRLPIHAFQHQESRGLKLEPGGSANFMIAAARMGMRVSALGALGDDLIGQFWLEVLRGEGVDVSAVTVEAGATSTLTLDLIDHARREHVFIGSAGECAPVVFTPQTAALLDSADALFMQGYSLLERQNAELVPAALAHARERHLPIYFDVGPTVHHLPPDTIRETLARSDVLMMTEDEVPLAAEGLRGDPAYAYLFGLGAHTLIIKQGADGCEVIRQDGRLHSPGFSVPVVDTVGAGDCFDAAWIYGQCLGWPLERCARFANAVGAATVQKVGAGRGVPTCAEIRAVLASAGEDFPLPC